MKAWKTEEADSNFGNLLDRLRVGDVMSCPGHPLFWGFREKLHFLVRLDTAFTRSEFAQKLEERRSRLFKGSWKHTYAQFDHESREFIRLETEKRHITGDTESLRSLVAYIAKKMRHVYESGDAIKLSGALVTTPEERVFDFLLRPFPTLILSTYDVLRDLEL
jgi:hypothetical protein